MTSTASTSTGSLWFRLYHGETAFDFVGRTRRWFIISGAVILIGLLSLAFRGLNFGIDFRGGTAWEVPTATVSVARARDVMRPVGMGEAKIQVLGSGKNRLLRVQADPQGGTDAAKKARIDKVSAALAKVANVSVQRVSVNQVGPSWGKDITGKAVRALIVFLIAVTIFISVRFEPKMALAALAALIHDILVTVGVYSVSGFEVTPATVVAFLTILGYSLYDTIVVFDKVQENTRGLAASGRMTYGDMVNLSMNQVLMRSVNTSLVAILPILSVLIVGAYILGATVLEDFGLALTVGLLTGAYSSIFIASPLLAAFKEREPRYATIRARMSARATGGPPLTPAAAAAAAGSGTAGGEPRDQVPASGSARPRPAQGGGRPGNRPPPRPRKKGKRR